MGLGVLSRPRNKESVSSDGIEEATVASQLKLTVQLLTSPAIHEHFAVFTRWCEFRLIASVL
jgi:hypothetical protein